ncbi:Alpha-galactosidase (fragment) [Candidatus Sulfotelmatobacter sp. SbA7]
MDTDRTNGCTQSANSTAIKGYFVECWCNLGSALAALCFILCVLQAATASAQVYGAGQKPYMGWTTWSQQSYNYPTGSPGGDPFQNETNVDANADAMVSSGLAAVGFQYINIDGDWDNGMMCACGPPVTWDTYGRPIGNLTRFPNGMAAVAAHIHSDGLLAGIYWEEGVPPGPYAANTPILGTPYTVQQIVALPLVTEFNGFYVIDFTKPGAQEYEDSIINLFAEWGYDYLKMDGVRTAENRGGTAFIDDRPDVAAFSLAVRHSGRRMYFNLSSKLNHDYVAWWEKYANGRRIDGDIECGGCNGPYQLTDWTNLSARFTDVIPWTTNAGPRLGWNDLDSLEVGNTANTTYPSNTPEIAQPSNPPAAPTSLAGTPALTDGLTNDQRRTMVTLWAINAAPLQLGDDLTLLDSFGMQLLTNTEVIAVDQSGVPGQAVMEGSTPVFAQTLGGDSYYVALFNLNSVSSPVTVNWINLGFTGSATVRDLWAQSNAGSFANGYTVTLNPYASSLLLVRRVK